MRPTLYRGALTRETLLFDELRIVARLLEEGKDLKEIQRICKERNLFQFPTERMVDNIASVLYRRLTIHDDKELVAILVDGSHEVALEASLYLLMLDNLLVYEFFVDVVGEKYRTFDTHLSHSDIRHYLLSVMQKDRKASLWSELTTKKIESVFSTLLFRCGYWTRGAGDILTPVSIEPELKTIIMNNGDGEVLKAFDDFTEDL